MIECCKRCGVIFQDHHDCPYVALEAENAKLRAVAEAAREVRYRYRGPFGAEHITDAVLRMESALAALDADAKTSGTEATTVSGSGSARQAADGGRPLTPDASPRMQPEERGTTTCPTCDGHGFYMVNAHVVRARVASASADHWAKQCDALRADVERLTRERDAYKRAKEENDDRFLTERDQARGDRDRAIAERDEWKSAAELRINAYDAADQARRDCDRATEDRAGLEETIDLQEGAIQGLTAERDRAIAERDEARRDLALLLNKVQP